MLVGRGVMACPSLLVSTLELLGRARLGLLLAPAEQPWWLVSVARVPLVLLSLLKDPRGSFADPPHLDSGGDWTT